MDAEASVDLYWLPLGAGGHSVRLNGRIFEFVAARVARRPTCDLYHSALVVRVPEGRFVIEQAPVRDGSGRAAGRRRGGTGCQPLGRSVADLPIRGASLARRLDTGRRRGGRKPAATHGGSSCGTPAAAARAAGADADVGTRRVLCGGDVELELGSRLADRPQRRRDRLDSPTRRRARSRLECRRHARASSKLSR